MSKRFTSPSAEELAARGLNPDGTPIAKPKKAPVKRASTKEAE